MTWFPLLFIGMSFAMGWVNSITIGNLRAELREHRHNDQDGAY